MTLEPIKIVVSFLAGALFCFTVKLIISSRKQKTRGNSSPAVMGDNNHIDYSKN